MREASGKVRVKMIREKSCGAVIFTEEAGERLYLVERMQKGHISICKGHVEGAETEHETAAREILEETGLTVSFIDGFRRVISYSPYDGCMKDVVFFLARADKREVRAQEEEVAEIMWLPFRTAMGELTHRSDRETLEAAEELLILRSRNMRRAERQLDDAQCERILAGATSGVLALSGDGGYPYAVPLSYVYEKGRIYFHGAAEGHKADAIRAMPKASFCVVEADRVMPREYTTKYRSVIAFGEIREISDSGEKRRAVELLAHRYNPGDTAERRNRYIDGEFEGLCMWELTVQRMTGKSNM